MNYTQNQIAAFEQEAADRATAKESHRWQTAMEEFGFSPHPGLSVKENLAAFGDWWAERKRTGN